MRPRAVSRVAKIRVELLQQFGAQFFAVLHGLLELLIGVRGGEPVLSASASAFSLCLLRFRGGLIRVSRSGAIAIGFRLGVQSAACCASAAALSALRVARFASAVAASASMRACISLLRVSSGIRQLCAADPCRRPCGPHPCASRQFRGSHPPSALLRAMRK